MSKKQIANWDSRFMRLALHIATWSKDRSRKVGCVIVGTSNEIRATGYNGFPRGVDDDVNERHNSDLKYKWTEHAERNAIYNAARAGVSLDGCRIYIPWFPCADCARAIIQIGIDEMIAVEPDWDDPVWARDFAVTKQLLDEVGVRIRWFDIDALD